MYIVVKINDMFTYHGAEGKLEPNGNEEDMVLITLEDGRIIPIPRKYVKYIGKGDELWIVLE